MEHADKYLFDAAMNKPCLNQRAWAATGLASLSALTGNRRFAEYATSSLNSIFAHMNTDMTFPYIVPNDATSASPKSEHSQYYHSRIWSFLMYTARTLGLDNHLCRAAESMNPIFGAISSEGIKPLGLETKKWFFSGQYETDSTSLDLYAAVQDFAIRGKQDSSLTARLETLLVQHIRNGGLIQNKQRMPNYLCPFVDNSDFVWAIRALDSKQLLDGLPEFDAVGEAQKKGCTFWRVRRTAESTTIVSSKPMDTNFSWGTYLNVPAIHTDRNAEMEYLFPVSLSWLFALRFPQIRHGSRRQDIMDLRRALDGFRRNMGKSGKSCLALFSILLNFFVLFFLNISPEKSIEKKIKFLKKIGRARPVPPNHDEAPPPGTGLS